MPINPRHAEDLVKCAVDVTAAETEGVTSVETAEQLPASFRGWDGLVPGLLWPWRDLQGQVTWQIKPDNPPANAEGKHPKYRFPKGSTAPLHFAKWSDDRRNVVLVEGTKQCRAVAGYAPDGWNVVGLAGCWNWQALAGEITGRHVVVLFDADLVSNPDVHGAAVALRKHLRGLNPASVRYVILEGDDHQGVDDILGATPEQFRATVVKDLLLDKARAKLPPRPQQSDDDGEFRMAVVDDRGNLDAQMAAKELLKRNPAALREDSEPALYHKGRYSVSSIATTTAVYELLGPAFRSGYETTVRSAVAAELYRDGRYLPHKANSPILNVRNGMLDLRSGELMPHDPKYMSSTQLPVDWDPEAQCPTYDRWLEDRIPHQHEDLEESVSVMLNPSKVPAKAVFLYGPSRSGKSTFIRLLEAMVGDENVSSVDLGTLSSDRFAGANLYGKMLNSSADLSAQHVEDISVFKMMTGGDTIQANPKYGKQFSFRNRALFAFSANTLPSVGEASTAYQERIKPFKFAHSFAGEEDYGLERRLLDELDGILVRWVRAWQRFYARGESYQRTAAEVMAEFTEQSDRIHEWVAEEMAVVPVTDDGNGLTGTQLREQYKAWAELNGYMVLGRNRLMQRLRNFPGVHEVRVGQNRLRGLNIVPRPDDYEPPAAAPVTAPERTEPMAAPAHIREDRVHCPACRTEMKPVGSGMFILSCPRCYPQTLKRPSDG